MVLQPFFKIQKTGVDTRLWIYFTIVFNSKVNICCMDKSDHRDCSESKSSVLKAAKKGSVGSVFSVSFGVDDAVLVLRKLRAYPSLFVWRSRAMASACSGTSLVIVDPAAQNACFFMVTGAIRVLLLPIKTSSSTMVLNLSVPL